MFRMYCPVEEPDHQEIQYLNMNLLYPYIMAEIHFPIGHPEIRCGHFSSKNLMDMLKAKGEKFLGFCQGKILPLDQLFVPCSAHKLENKLLFVSADFVL